MIIPQLSERTRRAVQDYTALNTIFAAYEHPADPFARAVLETLVMLPEDDRESMRVPLDCPLGRRGVALGVLRARVGGTRGVLNRKHQR
ncbi:hypothetical protein BH11GEM2_BH11GEM2_38150 [soil metagenome]